ncbi:hypothetical protein AVEN_128317-1 [Araneus ventricosus]|uniref:RNase H type-1 domain-containing protein n=1 Tax=Araneus ventricosus TaxID=182803 RepID=A0A4Y2JP06_ARAVE|nr:hypothetical protein AVEN_128317-1 [Araneus ventricosus]
MQCSQQPYTSGPSALRAHINDSPLNSSHADTCRCPIIEIRENHKDSGAKPIYTDGSKRNEGTGGAYCILENYGIIASWQGNECADQLAKEAITKRDPFFLPKPLSYLKSENRSAALSIWQDNWGNGETGRSTHDIVPRVSNKPVGWNREELMFVTGHGPFPSYLQSSNT